MRALDWTQGQARLALPPTDAHQPSAFQWFERVACTHANIVLDTNQVRLTMPGTLDVDLHTPGLLVGQVKSGDTPVGGPVLDRIAGAAGLAGTLERGHAWVYSEAGYKQGCAHLADRLGLFLWTVDRQARVRPFSPAAHLITNRAWRVGHADATAGELLDAVAFHGWAAREQARIALVDTVAATWREHGLPATGLRAGWQTFVLRTLEQGEIAGHGSMAADSIVFMLTATIELIAADAAANGCGFVADTRDVRWQAVLDVDSRDWASVSMQCIADGDARALDWVWQRPQLREALAYHGSPNLAKWRTPEQLWRDYLLAIEPGPGWGTPAA